MSLLDDNGDPIQFGIEGYQTQSDGLTHMDGPALGIVLSVHHSDDVENSWYELLRADRPGSGNKASYLEATVLLIHAESRMSLVVPGCVILQDKCSQVGPTNQEPADWSEDVPNGCSAEKVDQFFSDRAGIGLEELDGDWVIVDFLGGLLQMPLITQWFPSPFNKRDAATREEGRRFVLRRNNSEIQIDKNGDLHITHRVGQYIQMKGKQINIKHRDGALLQMGDDGSVLIMNKDGYVILQDGDGISLTNGKTLIELNGAKLKVEALQDEVRMSANNLNLVANSVIASTGQGGDAVCKTPLPGDFLLFVAAVDTMMTPVKALVTATTGGAAIVAAYEKLIKALTKKTADDYLTSVLAAE